ncbi:Lymphocyte antigen 6 complex locus protein G6f [Dissostichus eleginoides]|uniref:Lymphocyte antigen 6 complex locus protein G6f n=1 Tax=Dissostichus eleginoides TaxID=100907 RepID=A0AAD9F5Q3_DISEL|nr:Lymphocyte antigen 6 complex locus protein G6f [Dissostichus eleginoides]
MDEFKRIKMSLFLILLLQFTGPAIGQRSLSFFVRVGDEATLPCNYVIHDQDECDGTNWIFSDSGSAVKLVKGGQIGNHAKSDRLRVTEKCSLVIKKVTEEDAGYYTCRQLRSGPEQEDSVSLVFLSVVTMTEHQDNDEVTLNCSLKTYGWPQSSGEDTTAAATESDSRSGWWWWIIVVIVGVAALIIITVTVIRWKRTQGQRPQMDENIVRYDVDDGTVNYDNIRPPDGV